MHKKNQNRGDKILFWIHIVSFRVKDFRGVSLKTILREVEDLTGNTRFQSISALTAFFYEGMADLKAGKLLGYKESGRNCATSMAWRANQVADKEVPNLYKAYKQLKRAGILVKSFRWLLDPDRPAGKGGKPYSNTRVAYSKRIVREMVVAHGRSRRLAAAATGVPLSTINFWRNY
jgi:hypothetical protein